MVTEFQTGMHGNNSSMTINKSSLPLRIFQQNILQDRRFIYLGWIITLSLAMNGCAFDYFAPTVYLCLTAQSLENISLPVEELPPDKRRLVEKVMLSFKLMSQSHWSLYNFYRSKQPKTSEELIQVFRDDDHATFLLYESGSFKKPILQSDIEDKPTIIRELRDGVLYSSWAAILQLQ